MDPDTLLKYKPNTKGQKSYTLKVRNTNFAYEITIGKTTPAFTFVPEGPEIYHRLILRAVASESVAEFELKKSCCW